LPPLSQAAGNLKELEVRVFQAFILSTLDRLNDVEGPFLRTRSIIARGFHNHPDRSFRLCLALIVFFSIARVIIDVNGSLTIDEPFSANVVNLQWGEMLKLLTQDPATPLYYFLLKSWVYLFGDSEIAVRSLSTICFALTVTVVGITTKKLGGELAGIAGSMLASVSSVGLIFAGTARPYALLSLLTALSTLSFFYVLGLIQVSSSPRTRKTRPLPLLGFVTINVMGLLTHPIFFFFMVACNLAVLFKSRENFWIVSICNVLTTVIFLGVWGPFLFRMMSLPATNWMTVPSVNELIQAYLNLWGGKKSLLLIIYILVFSIWNIDSARRFFLSKPGFVGTSILMAASLLPFFVSQFRPVFMESRTPSLFFPVACVVVALLITRSKHLWLSFVVMAILFGSVAATPILNLGNSHLEQSPRSSMQYIVAHAQCGDIFISGGLSINETTYYMRRLNVPDCIQHKTFPKVMTEHPGWMDTASLLKNTSALEAEATDLTNHLNESLATHSKIWFFYESKSCREPVLELLKSHLDQKMVLMQKIDAHGTYFNSVFVYVSKSEEQDPCESCEANESQD
jgi:hypothetical protein